MAVGDVDDGIGDRYDGCWGGGGAYRDKYGLGGWGHHSTRYRMERK